jgi:hypothetical protein
MGRRKSRFDKLSARDAEAIIGDALSLRKTVLSAQSHLNATAPCSGNFAGL